MRKPSKRKERAARRLLVYVQILHSPEDMGTLSGTLEEQFIQRFGAEGWKKRKEVTARLWEAVRERLALLGVEARSLRLYQDGLPLCGRETEIVSAVALGGSPNYELLLGLVQQGAALEGTEDPSLLIEEYRLMKDVTEGRRGADEGDAGAEYQDNARVLIDRRDTFIAGRIDATLRPGETGVLFIGVKHKVDEKLPEDIEVRYLLEDYSLDGESAVRADTCARWDIRELDEKAGIMARVLTFSIAQVDLVQFTLEVRQLEPKTASDVR